MGKKQVLWWEWVNKPAEEVMQLAAENGYTTKIITTLPAGLNLFIPSDDHVSNRLILLVADNTVRQITLG